MVILDERGELIRELELKGIDLFDFYENHEVLDLEKFSQLPLTRRSQVLLVDTKSILQRPELVMKIQSVINTFPGAIFFHHQEDQAAQDWISTQASYLNKIIGLFTLPLSEIQWTILSNQLQFFWRMEQEQSALQKHLVKFSQELDLTIQAAEAEMLKAKKVHQLLIPKRRDEIKGITFLNKYAVGEGGGAEFYDLIDSGSKVYQVFICGQSYLVSSALIGLLNQHKNKKEFNPQSFLADARQEVQIINNSKKKNSNVEVMILELELTHLKLTATTLQGNQDGFNCYSAIQGNIDLSTGDYQMLKGDKLFILSPGLVFNWKESRMKGDLYSFITDHQHLPSEDLLLEIFMQVKHGQESNFLAKDATLVMMEVNRHGIHKV
jgi:hypothetical protein